MVKKQWDQKDKGFMVKGRVYEYNDLGKKIVARLVEECKICEDGISYYNNIDPRKQQLYRDGFNRCKVAQVVLKN